VREGVLSAEPQLVRDGGGLDTRMTPAPTSLELGGTNWRSRLDPVVGKAVTEQEGESIEELFGQLWLVPKSGNLRVPNPGDHGGGTLVWIRKELVQQRRIRSEVCFPVSRFQRIDTVPMRLSFTKDIWGGGDRMTFIEALRQISMAERGHWVCQVDRQERGASHGRSQQNRGRGDGFRRQG
jgi:hypothetical protein